MENVFVYSTSFDPSRLGPMLPGVDFRRVSSLQALAAGIVNEPDVLLFLIQLQTLTEEARLFLQAVKKCFPLLEVLAIASPTSGEYPSWVRVLDASQTIDGIAEELRRIRADAARDHRGTRRFDWPLQGQIRVGGKDFGRLRVRSLSASGAFLEYAGSVSHLGKQVELRIEFQDSSLLTQCEVLDPRFASSNLPAGFGVRFIDLSPANSRIIDAIVRNALVKSLLQPDVRPSVPTFGDEDRFSL